MGRRSLADIKEKVKEADSQNKEKFNLRPEGDPEVVLIK